jgi:hypothetical protein
MLESAMLESAMMDDPRSNFCSIDCTIAFWADRNGGDRNVECRR